MSTELVERRAMHTGEPAYKQYDPQMIALIKQTILPQEATDAELYLALELASTYRLDPFTKEIWIAKMPGRNAAGGKCVVMVGRDGMLAVAARHPDYRGIRVGTVHKADEFHVLSELRPWGDQQTQIHHVVTTMSLEERGEILGAYCEVYRAGHPPVYFIANLAEYLKADNEYTPWKRSPSVMIDKVAIVNALRLCYRVSGVYIADEFANVPLVQPGENLNTTMSSALDEDPWLNQRLTDLFDRAEAMQPGSYPPAKRKLVLAGARPEQVIEDLVRFIEQRGGEVPAEPERTPEAEAEVIEEAELTEVEPEPYPDLDAIPFGEEADRRP